MDLSVTYRTFLSWNYFIFTTQPWVPLIKLHLQVWNNQSSHSGSVGTYIYIKYTRIYGHLKVSVYIVRTDLLTRTPFCVQSVQYTYVYYNDWTNNYFSLLRDNVHTIKPYIDCNRTSISPHDNSMLCMKIKPQFGCELMLYHKRVVKYKYNSSKQHYKHKKLLYKR